jgi:hypothetical protein
VMAANMPAAPPPIITTGSEFVEPESGTELDAG